jgi:uncharacterized protein (TIGR01777 family)
MKDGGEGRLEKAVVTGASGFIGRRLLRELKEPVILARTPGDAAARVGVPPPGSDSRPGRDRQPGSDGRPGRDPQRADLRAFRWDAPRELPPEPAFEGAEVVFHLAGEPIAASRWTRDRKARIRESRVAGTRNLVERLRTLRHCPRVLISASAVGYYGDRGDELLDESSPPGRDFLAEVCQAWEKEALRAGELGTRVVLARISMALGRGGGALARMTPPFRLGLGAKLGDGRQWMPWIHRDDVAGLLLHAARSAAISGPVNLAAPGAVTNAEFTRALGAALRRPAVLAAPAWTLRLALGEMAEMLLGSQRVVPGVATRTGYRFRHETLPAALNASIRGRSE